MPNQSSLEVSLLEAKVRVDCDSASFLDYAFEDTTFLTYRLGPVRVTRGTTKPKPDILLSRSSNKEVVVENGVPHLLGNWTDGEIQRLVITALARSLEENSLYPLHASALRYRGTDIILMSGEENHGKTMSLIEMSRRGGEIIATESLIANKEGMIVRGTTDVFLEKRQKGTERADKPSPRGGVAKFFSSLPEFKYASVPAHPRLIILPDIDGNFDTAVTELNQFEKEYQTFHSISSFYSLPSLLSSGVIGDESKNARNGAT